jgi:DNA helicase-2/ATP-dependent DNA helicase PcrA
LPPAYAGGSDTLTRLSDALRAGSPRSDGARSDRVRSSQPLRDFVKLLEMLVQEENRNNPAKQIELILTNGYENYLQENYENADARVEDIKGLAAFAMRYKSTEDFLSELALLSTERFAKPQALVGEEVIEGGESDELLTLTSVHQAKGLEWKAVFIIWAAEGKFPSPRSLREIDSEEEERRLWYVALTRAKDELYLTYPLMITDYNRQTVLQKPSRFLTECPPALFEIWNLEEEPAPLDSGIALPANSDEYVN